ncbi:pseudouridine synthase [Candidatus Margulisiibacteriota bacterium]
MPPKVRLQKFMAECGVASRRAAEKLIAAGKVKVNGRAAAIGAKIDPASDKVEVRGELLRYKEKKVYIKLNKPVGVVSAASDREETTVVDLIKKAPARLYPVGRLDMGSEGLVLLTNDGELANRLMHPRYEHEKEYEVAVRDTLTDTQIKELEQGLLLDEKMTLPAKIHRLGASSFRIVLREGRNRQIRRMLEAVGNHVSQLKRIRIKNILLGKLRPGEYAYLTKTELRGLTS